MKQGDLHVCELHGILNVKMPLTNKLEEVLLREQLCLCMGGFSWKWIN